MTKTLFKVECDPNCGFLIRSHDKAEMVEIAKKHAEVKHNMKVSDEDIRKMVKTA